MELDTFLYICDSNVQQLGGTGMGIRIANAYDIPVHNLGDPETLTKICKKVGAVVL